MASLEPTRRPRARRAGDTFEQGGWTHPHLSLLEPPHQRVDPWTIWIRLGLLAAVAVLLTAIVLAFGAYA